MVTPNALLIASRGFVCRATVADSTRLVPPAEACVATTVRITLPASTVTVSTHAGKEHCSSRRKLALTASAFASYSSTVPPAFSTRVTFLPGTSSMVAPGCNGGAEGEGEGGGGGGGRGEGDSGGAVGGAGGVSGGAGGLLGGAGADGG